MSIHSIERFWDNYIEKLIQAGVPDKMTRWFVMRAEWYIRSFSEKKLQEHTSEELQKYLEDLGQNRKIKAWVSRCSQAR